MATTTSSKPDLSITTTEHPNAQRLRDGFASFARGDLDAVRASFTPDITWTTAGSGPLAGEHRGWDAVAEMFGTLITVTDGTFSMDLQSVVADDRHAVAIYDATSTTGGTTATLRFVMVDEMTNAGLVRATRVFAYDQEAADRHLSR